MWVQRELDRHNMWPKLGLPLLADGICNTLPGKIVDHLQHSAVIACAKIGGPPGGGGVSSPNSHLDWTQQNSSCSDGASLGLSTAVHVLMSSVERSQYGAPQILKGIAQEIIHLQEPDKSSHCK